MGRKRNKDYLSGKTKRQYRKNAARMWQLRKSKANITVDVQGSANAETANTVANALSETIGKTSCEMSLADVLIKEEPQCEEQIKADPECERGNTWVKLEPESQKVQVEFVKVEPHCEDRSGAKCSDMQLAQECAVKEDQHLIYEGHTMKEEEMVIGPEVLQEPTPPSAVVKEAVKVPEPSLHKSGDHSGESSSSVKCKKTKNITHKQVSSSTSDEILGNLKFKCDVCGKQFKTKGNLNIHLHTHSDDKPYSCNICDKKFAHKTYLTKHLRVHSGEKPHGCSICDKKFQNRKTLTTHLRVHTGERPYTCNVCDKKFTDSGTLKGHLRIHSGEKPFSCNICEKKFAKRNTLTNHLRIHSGERPYTCNICDKKFTNWGGRAVHLRIHSGEKPFSCNICDMKFTGKGALTTHLRVHSGEKPYTCDTCDKKFRSRGTLTSHLLVHSGEKPYSCEICNKKTTQKSALVRHMAYAHCILYKKP